MRSRSNRNREGARALFWGAAPLVKFRCSRVAVWARRGLQPARCSRLAAVVFAVLFCMAVHAAALPAVLTSARQIHNLPADQAATAIPIHLIATVTYSQPEEENLFVSDASGGVFVWGEKRPDLRAGDLVDIRGVTRKSLRTVVLVTAPIRVLRNGPSVIPQPVDYPTFLAGKVDCEVVSVRGVVHSASLERHGADTIAQLQLLMPGGLVQAYVQDHSQLDLTAWIDSEVEISGVAAAAFNAVGQIMRPKLLANSSSDLKLLHRPAVSAWNLPISDISEIEKSRYIVNRSQRVRVQGAVTAYDPGYSMVIQHGDRSLFVMTRQIGDIQLGTVVDVTGFPDDHAYAAVLENAQFLVLNRKEQVTPRAVTYADAISGSYSDALVMLRGIVSSELHGELADTIVIIVDGHPVELVLPHADRGELQKLPVGTVITARGICRVTPSTEWKKPLLFRLDLRDSTDLAVVTRPSWWTVPHLFMVIGALGFLSSIVLFWVVVLQRKVRKQTEQIRRSMRVERERSRLLEQINSESELGQLLEEICTSMNSLVKDAHCCIRVMEVDGVVSLETSTPATDSHVAYAKDLLGTRGQCVGSFRACISGETVLSEEDRKTLETGADLANIALNQRQLFADLNHRSTHDQLTGLPNRRRCDSYFESAMRRAFGSGRRMGVAYIDIDRFKQVNDRFGHKIGDLYLQTIAERLGRKVKKSDLLARIGGDEFLLIASDLNTVGDANAYKRRLQSCFDDPFCLEGVQFHGGASIGLAVFPDHGSTTEALKRYADSDMYVAKRFNHSHAVEAWTENLEAVIS